MCESFKIQRTRRHKRKSKQAVSEKESAERHGEIERERERTKDFNRAEPEQTEWRRSPTADSEKEEVPPSVAAPAESGIWSRDPLSFPSDDLIVNVKAQRHAARPSV